jgi:hypothetical protein
MSPGDSNGSGCYIESQARYGGFGSCLTLMIQLRLKASVQCNTKSR